MRKSKNIKRKRVYNLPKIFKKSTLIKYGITFILMGALFYAVLAVRDIFNLTDKKEILRTLCDAFTVPAVIAFCAGALVFVSSHGVFDGLGYIGRAILGAFIPGMRLTQKSYKEYKASKAEKTNKVSGSFLFICGGIFFLAAIALLIAYYYN